MSWVNDQYWKPTGTKPTSDPAKVIIAPNRDWDTIRNHITEANPATPVFLIDTFAQIPTMKISEIDDSRIQPVTRERLQYRDWYGILASQLVDTEEVDPWI